MVRLSESDFTQLCFKRLGILGTLPANHFIVRYIGFGCSEDSSEGFRTLDGCLKDLCVFPHNFHLWDSAAICVPWFPPGSWVSLWEARIPSLLVLGQTLPAFPGWSCLWGSWSTTQTLGAAVGEGSQWLMQPQISPSASAPAPLSAGALRGWAIYQSVTVEVGGWPWRWWWLVANLLLADLNIEPHLRPQLPDAQKQKGPPTCLLLRAE